MLLPVFPFFRFVECCNHNSDCEKCFDSLSRDPLLHFMNAAVVKIVAHSCVCVCVCVCVCACVRIAT